MSRKKRSQDTMIEGKCGKNEIPGREWGLARSINRYLGAGGIF